MTARVASLRLQLIDGLSGPGRAPIKTLSALERALQSFGKSKVPGMDRLVRQLQSLGAKDAAIKGFRGATRGLKDLSQELKLAKQNAARLEAAFKAATKPSAALKRELDSARSTLKQTKDAFLQHGKAAREALAGLRQFGIESPRGISSSQQKIRDQIAQTIKAMRTLEAQARKPLPQPPKPPKPPKPERPPGGGGDPGGNSVLLDMGTFYAGQKLSAGGVDIIKSAAQQQAQRAAIMAVAGKNGPEEVAIADQLAVEATAANPLTTVEQSLKDYRELRSLAVSENGNQPEDQGKMRQNVLLMAQARTAAAASMVPLDEGEARALAMAIEGSGRAKDPKALKMMVDAYLKARSVYGTGIDASGIRTFVQNAKSANFPMSDPAFYYTALARIAQGNPARLGNEFSQTFNTLVGGHMTKQGAEWMAQMGLIDPGQIRNGKGGKFYIDGGVKAEDLLSTDPTTWAQTVLLPQMEKNGVLAPDKIQAQYDTLHKQDPNAVQATLRERAVHGLIANSLADTGFRSTVTDNLIHAIANEFLTNKDVEQMKNAMGLDAASLIGQNPVAAFQELTAAFSNLGSVIGSPIMKDAAALMHSFAGGISEVTAALRDWQKDHPIAAEAAGGAAPAAMIAGGGYLSLKVGTGLLKRFGFRGAANAAQTAADAASIAASRSGVASRLGKVLPWASRVLGPAATVYGGYEAGSALHTGIRRFGDVVGGKYWRPADQAEADDLREQADQLRAEIAAIRAQSKVPGMADILVQPKQDALDQLEQRIRSFDEIRVRPEVDSSSIDAALSKSRQLRSILSAIGGGGGGYQTPANSAPYGGPRAGGGSVRSGETYLVGEKGPELLTMGSNGHVTPNHAIGGGGHTILVNLHGGATKDQADMVGNAIGRVLRRSARTSNAGIKPYGDY